MTRSPVVTPVRTEGVAPIGMPSSRIVRPGVALMSMVPVFVEGVCWIAGIVSSTGMVA